MQRLNIYKKLVGYLIKNGKKLRAKRIVTRTLILLKRRIKRSVFFMLYKLFNKLNIAIEAKTLKIKRSKYIVPFTISFQRRVYLILKWLIKAVSLNLSKIPIHSKIALEIFNVLTSKKNSNILKLKNENNILCIKNRSNLHYRW